MQTPSNPKRLSESRVHEILIGSLVPFAIASVTVAARFFTRVFLARNWGTDDSWVAVAWILETVLIVLNCLLTRYGAGRHQDALTEEQYQRTLLLGFFTRLIYPLVLGTTKIAICALFLRIFRGHKRGRYAIYGFMAFVGSYTTSLMFTSIFHNQPVSDAWKVGGVTQCSKYLITLWVTAICNILCDVVLLVFIVPHILSQKIDRGQKAALLGIVSLALLVIMAAIVRLARVTQFNSSSDQSCDLFCLLMTFYSCNIMLSCFPLLFSGDGSDITAWSAVESSVGLICACAPPLKPLYRFLRCRTSSTTSRHSDIYATRGHPYNNQNSLHDLRGTQRCVGNTTDEFGTGIESTTSLVTPIPVPQSYDMTVTTIRAEFIRPDPSFPSPTAG